MTQDQALEETLAQIGGSAMCDDDDDDDEDNNNNNNNNNNKNNINQALGEALAGVGGVGDGVGDAVVHAVEPDRVRVPQPRDLK